MQGQVVYVHVIRGMAPRILNFGGKWPISHNDRCNPLKQHLGT